MPTTATTHRPPPLLGYRRLRAVAVALLAVEFVVGMGGYLTPRHEIYPFASWFLFLLVPNDTSDYDLLLRANNGNPIDPPQPYNQAAWLVTLPHSILTYQLVQQLGDAETRHDAPRSRRLRRQIEALFTQPRVRYDLVRNTSRPIERYETGQVRARQSLRSFTSGDP